MVKLDKIYTRGGDAGETSLGDGSRILKYDVRVEAYGTVDEINAHLGVARLYCEGETDAIIGRIQNDLFDLGADLCRPMVEKNNQDLRITQSQIDRLENEIDVINEELSPLTSFILPGGSSCAAHLHVARTVTRRAERMAVKLANNNGENSKINKLTSIYLNRLSDHLFVLSRKVNDNGRIDVLWVPGKNR